MSLMGRMFAGGPGFIRKTLKMVLDFLEIFQALELGVQLTLIVLRKIDLVIRI